MMARLHERDQLAEERQQLSSDLSKLQTNARDAAREMAPSQPGVAKQLRDALTDMDESDLDNHVQRTADWLRSGIDPNSNGTENEIAHGLAKLSQQLNQAQTAMGQAKPGQQGKTPGDESGALDQLARLRNQLQAFGRPQPGNSRQPGPGNGQPRSNPGGRGASGDTPAGGGGANGTVWGNFDTGNNTPQARGQSQSAPADASGNPADTERTFAQGMRELNQLRQMIHDDPQAAKDVADLTRQMQRLDPSRFPGNPAMVEQMHREVLGAVDKLELELQRDGASTEARTGKPDAIPAGYQDSVAEYYRKLSKH
jgi:hypothetical protein